MKFAINQGIINLDDVRNSMLENERKRLLSKHKYKIFQDKDGRWKTTIPDESKKSGRKLVAKSTKEKLEKYLIDFYSEKEDLEYEKEKLVTIRNLFPNWLVYKNSHTTSSSSIKRIKNDWDRYYKNDSIVDIPIQDLSYIMLDKWVHDLIKQNNLTKKQYYNMSIIIRQIMIYALELGLIKENYFAKVSVDKKMFKKNSKPDSEFQVFTYEDETEVINAALNRYNLRPKSITVLALMLNFQLGLRVGELVALKWSDIYDNYIHIQRMEITKYHTDESGNVTRIGVEIADHTKSYAGNRKIYLNQKSRDILSKIKKRNMKYGLFDEDYIFVNSKSHRLTRSSINSCLYKLCDDININRKSTHKIRKTYISSLFDAGININKIREIAGHEDERTSLNNYCFDRNTDFATEQILESISTRQIVSEN